MVLFSQKPQHGEWYLTVTCQTCQCRILLFHDLNEGKGNLRGVFTVTCPSCKRDQDLPPEHYHHNERANPDGLCLELF